MFCCGNLPPILVKQTKFWYIFGSPKPPIGNQVKHLLIILISILLLSSPLIGQSEGPETIIILVTLKMLPKKIRGQFPDQTKEKKEEGLK